MAKRDGRNRSLGLAAWLRRSRSPSITRFRSPISRIRALFSVDAIMWTHSSIGARIPAAYSEKGVLSERSWWGKYTFTRTQITLSEVLMTTACMQPSRKTLVVITPRHQSARIKIPQPRPLNLAVWGGKHSTNT